MSDLVLETRTHDAGEDTAVLSADGVYRYLLTRTWGDGPRAVWIMLNPSTADAFTDDKTIRRVIGFSKREGCGSIAVVNLYALRATDPKELYMHRDPVGPVNARFIRDQVAGGGLVIAAWGNHGGRWRRGDYVTAWLTKAMGVELQCLGSTRADHPAHPLYLSKDTPLQPWPGNANADPAVKEAVR